MSTQRLSADDHRAIRDLAHRYFDAIDRGDRQALASVFDVDGELTIVRPEGDVGPEGTWLGRDEISTQGVKVSERYRLTAHILASHVVEVAEGVVTGRVRCVAHHLSKPDEPLTDKIMILRYHDVYRRVDEEWLIAQRVLRLEVSAFVTMTPVSGQQ